MGRDETLLCKGNRWIAGRARRADFGRLIQQTQEPLGSCKRVRIQERSGAFLRHIGSPPDDGMEADTLLDGTKASPWHGGKGLVDVRLGYRERLLGHKVLLHVIEWLVELEVHLGHWVERLVAPGPVEHGRLSKQLRRVQVVSFQVGLRDVPEAVHEGRVAHNVVPAHDLVREREVWDPEAEREGRLGDQLGFVVGAHVVIEDVSHVLRPPLGQVDTRYAKVPARLNVDVELFAVKLLGPAQHRVCKLILLADAVPALRSRLRAPTVSMCLVLTQIRGRVVQPALSIVVRLVAHAVLGPQPSVARRGDDRTITHRYLERGDGLLNDDVVVT